MRHFVTTPVASIEAHALKLEQASREVDALADAAWLSWCRAAVHSGVRCDVDPRSLLELPRVRIAHKGTDR